MIFMLNSKSGRFGIMEPLRNLEVMQIVAVMANKAVKNKRASFPVFLSGDTGTCFAATITIRRYRGIATEEAVADSSVTLVVAED